MNKEKILITAANSQPQPFGFDLERPQKVTLALRKPWHCPSLRMRWGTRNRYI